MAGLRYPFSESFSAVVSGFWDTQLHGRLAHVEATWALSDVIKLTGAIDGLWGDPGKDRRWQ